MARSVILTCAPSGGIYEAKWTPGIGRSTEISNRPPVRFTCVNLDDPARSEIPGMAVNGPGAKRNASKVAFTAYACPRHEAVAQG